ncbi:hypothetical protein ABE504_06565 [Paenibacillus oryzisoli]|uniref:hypothetical protein n=1 Tax=Paenibacillus oryzisoli TaxID=1850517 RepID=UPI003D2673E4
MKNACLFAGMIASSEYAAVPIRHPDFNKPYGKEKAGASPLSMDIEGGSGF